MGEHERKEEPKKDYEPKHAKDPDNTDTIELPPVKDREKK
jgi:hypothetical protein